MVSGDADLLLPWLLRNMHNVIRASRLTVKSWNALLEIYAKNWSTASTFESKCYNIEEEHSQLSANFADIFSVDW